jgi:hypothetical protein
MKTRPNSMQQPTQIISYHRNLTPPHGRAIISNIISRAFVFFVVIQSSLVVAQAPQALPSAVAIEKMIEGLGSDDFLFRQRSSEQLLEAGSAAIPQLRSAQTSLDQEVRYRANDVLKKILETDLEERAKRFLAVPPRSGDVSEFQHWNSFSRLAGTSREARSLLVAIHSNPKSAEVLREINLNRNASEISHDGDKTKSFDDQSVTSSVEVYAAEMYRRSMQSRADQASRLAGSGVVEELFASAFESNFLSLSPITVQQSEHKLAFLKLLTAWLKSELQTTPMTLAKLKIISNYHLKAFADDLADVLNQPQYPHKQAAIESLCKIFSSADEDDQATLENDDSGVVDAISQLRPFVLSDEVLVRLPQAETKGPVEVTLGDFAFQLILNMQEKAPNKFGMSEASGRMYMDNKSIFCFKNREAAVESIQEWLAAADDSQSNVDP